MGKIVKYNMELEVLTPLHIASGEELNKMEYLFNEYRSEDGRMKGKLRIVDNIKLMSFLMENNLFDKYFNYIQNCRNISLSDFFKKNKISEEKVNTFIKKIYINLDLSKDNLKNGIKKLNRDIKGKPYIQGSSIKGALVNSLLVNYIINHRSQFENEKTNIYNMRRERNFKNKVSEIIQKLEVDILKKDMKNDKVKVFGISISDTYRYENTRTNFYKDVDRHLDTKKESFMPVTREYIMPKSKFYFDITIDFDMLSKTKLGIKNASQFIESLENANYYFVNNTLDFNNGENNYNLILGANTGYHQKTILHALFKNKNERTEVVKRILHKGNKDKMSNHIDDSISPRVLNGMNVDDDFEVAGFVKIRKIGEKNVGSN